MIDLSAAGLLGATIGLVAAAIVYAPLVKWIERRVRARQPLRTMEEHATLVGELSLLRRAVLALDIGVLAGFGYWLGQTVAG
jgi:hypothetical protein